MGIQGLLPFLKKASRQASIKEFKGCTVAIDSYCWLHRGAFACAEKLALGETTDQYVYYCMKYINNLLSFDIRPIMVFDGCRLPSKKEVERTRRERREMNRKKAAQLLREGKRSEARDCLAQCIDITPHMALELMNACREKGVDCIVAPYEADAQLAYLNKIGLAQVVITEDSDLLLFGCEKIMFKMDIAGNGILIEKNDLNNALQLPLDVFTFDKFRYLCILSGCDYLSNLPGIGLAKASKLFRLSRQNDVSQVIRKMPSILRMSSLVVPEDYVDGFFRANNTFLYQLVFDPLQRKLLPLNPYPDDLDPKDLDYAGPYMSDEDALQIALGNTNVNTGKRIADFDPDVFRVKTNSWSQNAAERLAMSIWNTGLDPRTYQRTKAAPEVKDVERPSTKGMEVIVKGPVLKDRANVAAHKRARQAAEDERKEDVTDQDLVKMYSVSGQSVEALMPCSINNTSFTAVIQTSPSRKRSKMSKPELMITDELNEDFDCLTRSDTETSTNSVLSEVLNVATDPTESCSVDVERGEKRQHLSPVKGCVPGKENSPEPPLGRALYCHSQAQPKQKNVFAMEGKAPKELKTSLNSSKLDTAVENILAIEGKDIAGPTELPEKQRSIFVADGKEPKQASSQNLSKFETAVEIGPGSEKKNVSSPSQVQPRRRNIFAVDEKSPKEQRFSLNASKLDTTVVNVKSRFFTMSPPSHETKFFQELKKEHCNSNSLSPSLQNNTSGSEEEHRSEEEEEEVIKGQLKKKPSDFCPSTGLSGDCSSLSVLQAASDPHKNFKSSQLSSFKSQFDNRQTAALQATARTSLPFKSVAAASGDFNLKSNDSYSASSQSSSDGPSKEDSDCLSEDPLDKSASQFLSSNLTDYRKLASEKVYNSSGKQFASGQRLSLDCKLKSLDKREVLNGITDGKSLHRRRLSMDNETREMSESPTGKSSAAVKGFISNGCRASGLLKTKTKGGKSAAVDSCKQLAISQYFQNSFALNKKSVSKVAPSVKNPV